MKKWESADIRNSILIWRYNLIVAQWETNQ